MNFQSWLREEEEMQPPDAKNVSYVACVLNKFSQTTLMTKVSKWLVELTGSNVAHGWIGRSHHMTVKFAPKQTDLQAYQHFLGQEFNLVVTHWAADSFGVAVVVQPPSGLVIANAIPHITVAHSNDVKPVYSNTLLADKAAWLPAREAMSLQSELVCVLRDQTTLVPAMVNPASPSC